ncbi:cytoplasmic alpha-amylase [Clostridioides difficile]|nr:cytoplasmic alpha-amylase [Clostridioides difficile]
MSMGSKNISTTFIDITGNIQEEILIDNEGNGIFKVNNKSYSIWIKK